MGKLYIQGSLYLKKEPNDYRDEMESVIEDSLLELDSEQYEELMKAAIDYESAKSVYQLIISKDGMFLRQRLAIGDYLQRLLPIDKKNLDNDYINLSSVLTSSNYIGKRGRMVECAKDGSDIFIDYREPIVLYKSDKHIILYNDSILYRTKTPIEILDSRFCNDWEFFGEDFSIYQDGSNLYRDLLLDSIPGEKILKREFPKLGKR